MLGMRDFHQLRRMVNQIHAEAKTTGYTNRQLAARAGLCEHTVGRLLGFHTVYPRTQTVLLMARAVGLEVVLRERLAPAKGRQTLKIVG